MPRRASTKASNANTKAAAAAPPPEPSLTVEEQRNALVRKLAIFASDWRRCPRPLCRRTRGCMLPDLDCFSPRRARRLPTPEEQANIMQELKRMLERRRAELG
jgi:hypothetical protein